MSRVLELSNDPIFDWLLVEHKIVFYKTAITTL